MKFSVKHPVIILAPTSAVSIRLSNTSKINISYAIILIKNIRILFIYIFTHKHFNMLESFEKNCFKCNFSGAIIHIRATDV